MALLTLDQVVATGALSRRALFYWLKMGRLRRYTLDDDRRTFVDHAELMRALSTKTRKRSAPGQDL